MALHSLLLKAPPPRTGPGQSGLREPVVSLPEKDPGQHEQRVEPVEKQFVAKNRAVFLEGTLFPQDTLQSLWTSVSPSSRAEANLVSSSLLTG